MRLKINRGLDTKKHQGLKKIFKEGVYLSWWIANLGVEPLLLFAAFLFLPALVFLRALLFFVTFVFDTISFLLQRKQLCELRRIKYLPRFTTSVKVLTVLFCFNPQGSFGSVIKAVENQSLMMSIGEIRELSLPELSRFTLSNSDAVSHKYIKKKSTLLIKAKKLGLSELHVWDKNAHRKVYQIYVLSKSNQLKLLSLAESLKSLDLEVVTKGQRLHINGKLSSITIYNQYLKILKLNKEKIQAQVELTDQLKKQLLTKTIKALFDDHISGFKCVFAEIDLICHLSAGREPSPELEKYLKNTMSVKFIRHISKNKKNNFRLKIKIIQIESLDAEAHGFGLHQLSGDIKGIFDIGWKSLYENNKIILKDLGIDASLLAEPIVLIRPDRKVNIQVGANIPYPTVTSEGVSNTIFKFAGLKLSLLLKKEGDGYLIDYSAEITKPGKAGEISGSKESASARLQTSEPLELFQINFQTDINNSDSLPLMGSVPFLSKLFSNNKKNKSFKKITGIIVLEEE